MKHSKKGTFQRVPLLFTGVFSWVLFFLLFFTNVHAQFVQQSNKLTAIDAIRVGLQGTSVALSADGKTAVVGGPLDGFTGAVWVYTENNGVWVQQGAKLIGSDAVSLSSQGNAVAISADGNTLIAGGPDDNSLTGAAWVFTRTAGIWTQQGPKLVGTGGIGQTAQGVSVALSADGNTAIIGGSNDNNFKGAAWIFTRNNGVWTQQGAKLQGAGAIGKATQGYSVGLSADGNTAIIGGSNDNSYRGAAWIFKRNGNSWVQQGAKLVGTGATYQAIQGTAVALSGDGNTAIIGGKHDNNYKGSAWIFVRSGNNWVQQGSKISGADVSGYAFQGYSVDLSYDGNTAIIGGYGDNQYTGAAWVFVRNGVSWSQQGNKLVGSGVAGSVANQGASVSLSDDGHVALFGGPYDHVSSGAAWVFVQNNGNWQQQGDKLVGTGGIPYAFEGYSVGISADGNSLVMGGYYENYGEGAAWVFTRKDGVWEQQGLKLIANDGSGTPAQGFSADMSADGNTIIVGGPWDNDQEGAAWIFVQKNGVWEQEGPKLVGTGGAAAYQGRYVALSGDGNTAVVCGPRDNNNTGAVWIFTRQNGVWTQQGEKITCSDPQGSPYLGRSADLSYNGNVLIAGGTFDNNNTGAAWIFSRENGVWSQQGNKLVGTDAVGNAGQGVCVSISNDGRTALVTGTGDNYNLGATWIYTQNGSEWIQEGNKLVGNDAAPGYVFQGISAAISGDGNTAVIGGYGDAAQHGAVWVFERQQGVWTQQGPKLLESDAVNNAGFGYSIDVSADGKTFVAGGPWENSDEGAAWVFAIPSCDFKSNACVSFEIMGITEDSQGRKTYEFRVNNACEAPLVYAAFQIPDGLVADGPGNDQVFSTLTERTYVVRNPNFSPFYSVRYKSVNTGIADGHADLFRYTLPPQANPEYIHAVAKIASNQSFEAHLNVRGCPVQVQPDAPSPEDRSSVIYEMGVYPNPSNGQIWIDYPASEKEDALVRVCSLDGKILQSVALPAGATHQVFSFKPSIPDGLYLLRIKSSNGTERIEKIVLQR